jgi:hypothetical protein
MEPDPDGDSDPDTETPLLPYSYSARRAVLVLDTRTVLDTARGQHRFE